jgi:hypothetical protein
MVDRMSPRNSNKKEQVIQVSGRTYTRNPDVDRYQIDFHELDDLRMCDIPPQSHLEILGLPHPTGAVIEVYGLNTGELEQLCVYGGVDFRVSPSDVPRTVLRLQQAFPHTAKDQYGFARSPQVSTRVEGEHVRAHVFLNISVANNPQALVRHAVAAYEEGLARLTKPSIYAFICYASEDRSQARELATAISQLGADVWLDEREIRVGDSIVQRISDALGIVSHVIVLLSQNSVGKPWVQRELSSAVMLQLSQKRITVLPIRLDDCPIPSILADIKYADGRAGMASVVNELELLFDCTQLRGNDYPVDFMAS